MNLQLQSYTTRIKNHFVVQRFKEIKGGNFLWKTIGHEELFFVGLSVWDWFQHWWFSQCTFIIPGAIWPISNILEAANAIDKQYEVPPPLLDPV